MTTTKRTIFESRLSRRSVLAGAAGSAVAIATGALPLGSLNPADAAASPRQVLSFDAGWRFRRGALTDAEGPSYDDSQWRQLDLPHDWSIEDLPGGSDDGAATSDPSTIIDRTDPSFNDRAPSPIGPHDKDQSAGGGATAYTVGGEGWYRKHFAVGRLGSGERVVLAFGGVYANSDVWLNGQHLGFHPNGYTPFQYDLTPYLRSDDNNVLAVRVRNTGRNSRYYSGSGIYRHTTLSFVKAVHIPWQGVGITTPTATRDAAQVDTVVDVRNLKTTPADVQVRVTVLAPSGVALTTQSSSRVVEPGATSAVAVSVPVTSPRLWSLEDPALYRAQVDVVVGGSVVDQVIETFGIRTIRFDSSGFALNGKTLKMRGACIHHDHGPLGAVSLYAAEERRIKTMKEAGFNAIRYAHQCPSAELLEICDRLGVLVYDEFTDMWDGGKNPDDYHLYFAEWWKQDLTSMVMLDRNHPSVVIRSIGNEVAFQTSDTGSGPLQPVRGAEMVAHLHNLDPTRPVTQGGGDSTPLNGISSVQYCDVGDVHYERDYTAKALAAPGKAWVQSESFIGSLYDYWKAATDHDFAIGDFSWTGWDYLGEAGLGHPLVSPTGTGGTDPTAADDTAQMGSLAAIKYPWYAAGCGDIDFLGELKPQMRYRRVVWGVSDLELLVQRPTTPVEAKRAGWGWCDELESWTWDVPAGRLMTVRAYTTADEVELLLNGIRVEIRSLTPVDKRIASFVVPYAAGTLVAVARTRGQEIGRKTLQTVGAPAGLRLRPYRGEVTTSPDDLAYVTVEVVDAKGNVVPDAVVPVGFGVDGGRFAGTINGNPHNVDSIQRPRRWTYHGKALMVLRPPKKAGTITVNAMAPGLQATSLSIPVVNRPYPLQ